jgi:hypothetical protein
MPPDLSAGAGDLAQASKSVMDLWSAAAAMCGKLATAVPTAATEDGIVEATFRKIADPRSWMGGTGEMDDVLGRMAEGPRFADLWEAERRYASVLRAWMNVRRRGLEHNAVVLEAWLQAGRQFTEQVAAGTDGNVKALDAKAALSLWTEIANQRLLETQRSEPFLQSQSAMIRATTDLRMAQQELVEHFGKQYGFPTRTELDDVHRTLTEMRRELRAMQREHRMLTKAKPMAVSRPATAPAAAAAAAKPVRRTAASAKPPAATRPAPSRQPATPPKPAKMVRRKQRPGMNPRGAKK